MDRTLLTKKSLFIGIGASVIIIGAVMGIVYFTLSRNVRVVLAEGVSEATLYSDTKEPKEIKRFTKNGDIRLESGSYYIIPKAENSNENKIVFNIKGSNTTITVNPDYTEDYLAKLFEKEKSAAGEVIVNKYKDIISDYMLQQGKLYGRGDWLGTLLVPNIDEFGNQKTPYRMLLHKKDGQWAIIRRAEYTLSAKEYNDVPITILRAVNDLT